MFEFFTKYNFYYNLSQFTDILLALFVLFFFIRFLQYRRRVLKQREDYNVLTMAWKFINEPGWLFFSSASTRDATGTFECSYDEHKILHARTKLFYWVVAGFVVIKMVLLVIQIFVFNKPLF